MNPLVVTIDGPAAAGKGAIAKHIKKRFNFFHIDSGLMYRNLAKIIIDNKVKIKTNTINLLIKEIKFISIKNNRGLRTAEVSKMSSKIAKIKEVRKFINLNQRKILNKNITKYRGIVIDGRDIGSVVFKDAQIKLYIIADPKIRAKRRHKELIDEGEKSIYSNVLKDIKLRDIRDKNRKNSPLVIPKNATIINNSNKFSKTIKIIEEIIRSKLNN